MTYSYQFCQLRAEEHPEASDRLFCGYDATVERFGGVDTELYQTADVGTVRSSNPYKACEMLYAAYNADERPHGYRGRSMSVSDIVILCDDSLEESAWFCDIIGFRKLKKED